MASDGPESAFVLDGNTLHVRRKLRAGDKEALAQALQELIDTGLKELVIDLSGVAHMTSTLIAPIAHAMGVASDQGQHVTVTVNKEVAYLLSIAGVGELGEIRVVEG